MVSLLDIRESFKGTIRLGEPLAKYASLGIGGPADYVFVPSSRNDLIRVVEHLRESGIPFLFVGRGGNLLVSDQGYHGAALVLEPGFSRIQLEPSPVEEMRVHAAAGARLAALVDFCVQHGLQGMEMLAGMPGTVGGLVAGGGRAAGLLAEGCLVAVEILRESDVMVISEAQESFAFRTSGLGRDVVLGATLRLQRGNKGELMRLRRQFLLTRNADQPLNVSDAGIMFQDPPGTKAYRLVEGAGMKGFRCGGAAVSERHANMVLNTGKATARDALNLIRQVQRAVREKTTVQLSLAMRTVGFEDESMLEVA